MIIPVSHSGRKNFASSWLQDYPNINESGNRPWFCNIANPWANLLLIKYSNCRMTVKEKCRRAAKPADNPSSADGLPYIIFAQNKYREHSRLHELEREGHALGVLDTLIDIYERKPKELKDTIQQLSGMISANWMDYMM